MNTAVRLNCSRALNILVEDFVREALEDRVLPVILTHFFQSGKISFSFYRFANQQPRKNSKNKLGIRFPLIF